MGQEDEQRLEEGMCCAILSQGHEVVRLGYSMMSSAAAMGRTRIGIGITQTGLPGSWIRENPR
jgi:hypothetical protein